MKNSIVVLNSQEIKNVSGGIEPVSLVLGVGMAIVAYVGTIFLAKKHLHNN